MAKATKQLEPLVKEILRGSPDVPVRAIAEQVGGVGYATVWRWRKELEREQKTEAAIG